MDAAWYGSANGDYFRYVKKSVDQFVGADGSISTYDESENSLDNVLLGRQLLLLYGVTQDKRYYKAATTLRQQLAQQPKNASGGLWHKKIYPNQMWLDGLYMAEPFYAEYAAEFQEPQDFAEITRQFVLIDQHARDAKTGLLYHGWDETKQQPWANPETGDSPSSLGARHGLVPDGAGGYAAVVSGARSGKSGIAGDFAANGRRSGALSGWRERAVVSGAG